MKWAFPSQASCKTAMREAVKNYGLIKGEATRLKQWIENNFEETEKYDKFVQALYGEDLNLQSEIDDLFNQLEL